MTTSTVSTPINFWHSKTNLFFSILLFSFSFYFLIWALGYTNNNAPYLLVIATLFGLFMAFNIGGNDVANSFGTSVGAGTLTIKQALAVAAVFEVSGAVLAGGEVTETIRKGIVDLTAVSIDPMQFVLIMMSSLFAAAFWLLFATQRGWPVSTTHSIIGGIVGSAVATGFVISGPETALSLVHWDQIATIALSWVISPLLGGIASYMLYFQIKKHILKYNESASQELESLKQQRLSLNDDHKRAFERLSELQQISYTNTMVRDAEAMREDDFAPEDLESDYYRQLYDINSRRESIEAHHALENWVPIVAAIGAAIISSMLLFKGLKNIDLGLTTLHNYFLMAMIAAVVWMSTFIFAKTLKSKSLDRATFLLFSWMQVFTAAGFAFSHGSNDIANAIGPFAAIMEVIRTGEIGTQASIPPIAMLSFGVALIAGLWFIGKEVIQTVGHNLTSMHPASGFSAELAAAGVVMVASTLGIPVSSTHILIGAVLGIGLVNNKTNWELMKPIGMAWIITLPASALLSALCFMVLRQIF